MPETAELPVKPKPKRGRVRRALRWAGFVALPSATKEEHHEKIEIAKLLHNILGQPAAYADRVWIEDFNLSVTSPENVTELQGGNLRLDPDKPGWLQLARLAAPGIPVW